MAKRRAEHRGECTRCDKGRHRRRQIGDRRQAEDDHVGRDRPERRVDEELEPGESGIGRRRRDDDEDEEQRPARRAPRRADVGRSPAPCQDMRHRRHARREADRQHRHVEAVERRHRQIAVGRCRRHRRAEADHFVERQSVGQLREGDVVFLEGEHHCRRQEGDGEHDILRHRRQRHRAHAAEQRPRQDDGKRDADGGLRR
jgi:hypothetical protein